MQEKVDLSSCETQRLPRVNTDKLLAEYKKDAWLKDVPVVKIVQDEEHFVSNTTLARMNALLQYAGIYLSVLIGHHHLEVKQIMIDAQDSKWLDLICQDDEYIVEHIKVPWYTTFHLNLRQKVFLK